MSIYVILLMRFIHVVAGILWGGTAVFYLFYVKPAARKVGPAGPQFMQALVQRQRYPMYMMLSSLLTILAGAVLYWSISGGINLAWIQTGPGLGYTIGSVAALVAFFIGALGIGPTSSQMGALGGRLTAAGRPPSAEQLKEMGGLEKRLSLFENLDFILLVVAMVTMATARYWYL